MKTLMILALLVSSSAFGQVKSLRDISSFLPKIKSGKMKTEVQNPTELFPIRHARIKAQITKTAVIDNGDGTTTTSSEVVCVQEVSTPVYDLRSATEVGPLTEYGNNSCPTTYDGKATNVVLTSAMYLSNGSMFDGEQPSDGKFAFAWLSTEEGMITMELFGSFFGGTREVNSSSIMGYVATDSRNMCTQSPDGTITCTPAKHESFSASLEFKE